MRRVFVLERSITGKKSGKICVTRRIRRPGTMSSYTQVFAGSHLAPSFSSESLNYLTADLQTSTMVVC
jgi:hypothetical protein